MKGIHLFVVLFFVVSVFYSPAFANDNPWEIKLPFKTAVIHYKNTGSLKGEEKLYIRKGGKEMAKITNLSGKVMFVPMKDKKMDITTVDWIYNVDMEKQEAQKFTNPKKFMMEEYNKLSQKEKATVLKNMEEIGMNMTNLLGGTVKKKASKILGYTCDVVTVMGTTIHTMTKTPIPLKTVGNVMVIKINSVATKIEKNVKVPDDIFKVPPGIKVMYIKEQDDLNREMSKSMIANLKDPDAAKKMKESTEQMKQEMETEEGEKAPVESEEAQEEKPNIEKTLEEGLKGLKGIFGN
ncbi:MAG: hypothetical protein IME96_11130 [Proteobacteria bacterium]|nr:hypothetical protein [Pseudomonadota bacterium]